MSLADYYRRQRAWRAWPSIFSVLPPVEGRTVLDLGCGVGDQAVELVTRGARVIGLDLNEEVIREARSRRLRGAEFHVADLRTMEGVAVMADGIWSSFAAAYFPDLRSALTLWEMNLRPGGWIALTEVDDMFGHQPLQPRTEELLRAYAESALAARRYDFFMGRRLRDHLEGAGLTVAKLLTVGDQELSFDGPAASEVVEAWRMRFGYMKILQEFCGPEFQAVRDDFLACLARQDHRADAKVYCCVALKAG